FAQQNLVEISPNANPDAVMSRDTFNLEFSFPCTAFVGEYGVETNGTYIYVAQWLGDSIGKYDQSGNVIETFVITGVERVRDMAYDGQYYYGGNNNNYFYVLDLENKVLINTIQTSFNVRGMAYDPIEDVLWTSSNWAPEFHKIDKQGNILDYWIAGGITMDHIPGLAFDNYTYGGPSLWGFSQDSTGVVIVKYDIATQSQTGNMIDMSSIAEGGSGYAGGLFIDEMQLRSGYTLGGCIQNDVIFAFDLDYANQMVVGVDNQNMISSLVIYPNPVSDLLNISIKLDDQANVNCRIYNQAGQLVHNQNIAGANSSNISVDISAFDAGTYMVQLSGKEGYSITKKFLKTN
ncbi:MAG: T9SS type A sorting domain-containing protein, partial [Bacteroidetes bacterium]|nr:T9SS type A sorting domain-containing protein [Bacteroidota bacterium]